MKKSDQIILILVLIPLAFVIGNLTSENFEIKSTLGRMFNKPTATNIVNQKQQAPIKNIISSTTSSKTNTIQQLPQTLIKKIGESYTLGSIEYKVTSAINNGSTYNYSKTTGKFIIVKILVKNIGKVGSEGSVIIIKDKNDRQYKQSDIMDGIMVLNGKTYGSSDYNGLAPGFSETYIAVFNVAKDSTDLKLCHPSTTGVDLVCIQLGL